MGLLVNPIAEGKYDFVIGSRTRGKREAGSLNLQQIIAGRGAGFLVYKLYGARYTDMCPFRAIRREALDHLGMREMTYGWNLEMQMRAARKRTTHLGNSDRSSTTCRRNIEGFRQCSRHVSGRDANYLDTCSGCSGALNQFAVNYPLS